MIGQRSRFGLIAVLTCLTFSPIIDSAFAQTNVTVSESPVCFLNYTAGVDLWNNCGANEDYIAFALLPFEWVTGGLFSMIIVSIVALMTWIKYHTVIYPIAIGIVMLPMSFFLFPDVFLSYLIVMMIIGIGAGIYYGVVTRANRD